MVHMQPEEAATWQRQVLLLEAEGKVTRTFRRLDPDRQWSVVEAIVAEAAERGSQAMQVKSVAARAGIAVGSLYRYFPRREGMLDVAVEVTAGFLTASLGSYESAMAQLPLRDGLGCYLSAGVEWSAANLGLLSFFAQAAYAGSPGAADTLVRPVAQSMKRLIRALLDGALARGELRDGVDVESATRLVLALTTAVGDAELIPHLNDYYLLFDAEHSPEQIRDAAVDFVVTAIGRDS